ncbi:MAG: hypothetical protein JRE82_07780, partial [Deltaproteobacteria bacterium]|nr:hypothetical protein [Deltaproteobacteria bacterium]
METLSVSPEISKSQLIWVPFALMAIGSWTPVVGMWLNGIEWSGGAGRAIAFWYTVPVLVAILLAQGPWLKQSILKPLGLRFSINRWWGIAWLLPVAVLFVGMLVTWDAGFEPVLTVDQLIETKRATVPPDQLAQFNEYLAESPPPHPLMLIVMGMPAGLTFNLIPALCEEIAFRGYYFREV